MIRQSLSSDVIRGHSRFGDKILHSFTNLERDQTKNRLPLWLIARWHRSRID
jgi:hypothetical protein